MELEDNVLGYIFSEIRKQLNLSDNHIRKLIMDYTALNSLDISKNELYTDRSYLFNDLTNNKLSWRKFCANMLFINHKEFTINLNIYRPHHHKTLHTITVIDEHNKRLASLYHFTLQQLGVNNEVFVRLMNEYIDRTYRNSLPSHKVTHKRNNTKALTKNELTWRFFCIGLKVLEVTKFDFEISFESKNYIKSLKKELVKNINVKVTVKF